MWSWGHGSSFFFQPRLINRWVQTHSPLPPSPVAAPPARSPRALFKIGEGVIMRGREREGERERVVVGSKNARPERKKISGSADK